MERSKGGPDEFWNLIALCATCHSRMRGGDIDRKAAQQYKTNLAVLNGRYAAMELRVLTLFAENPSADYVDLPWGHELHMFYLLRDGFVELGRSPNAVMQVGDYAERQAYFITPAGREFVGRWQRADSLE